MCAFLTLFWKLSGEQTNVYYVCYVISNLPESYIKKMFIGKSSKLVAFTQKLIYICPHGIWHGSIFYDIYIYTGHLWRMYPCISIESLLKISI